MLFKFGQKSRDTQSILQCSVRTKTQPAAKIITFSDHSHLHIAGGGHSLIKVTGGPTLRLLPVAVKQLKLLPKVDTRSHR